jgi:cell division protein FtsN
MADQANNKETDKNEQSDAGSKKKSRGLYVLVFLISAWMFFLGVLVGRGTVPVSFDIQELQRQVAELKRQALQREQSKAPKMPSDAPEPKPVLGFYDELKREGSYEDLLGFPDPIPEETPDEIKTPPAPEKEKKPPPKPETAEPKKTEPPKTEPPENESLKNYSIQVVSSKDRSEADKLVEKLKKKGYSAYRVEARLQNGGIWHRVRIGPFKGYSEAQRILGAVKQERGGALILEH